MPNTRRNSYHAHPPHIRALWPYSRSTHRRAPRPINFSGSRRVWNRREYAARPVFRRRRRR